VLRIVTGKTASPLALPLSRSALDALAVLREASKGERIVPFSLITLRRAFDRAKRDAKITRRMRWHSLRAAFASDLLAAGVPTLTIQRALTHSSPRTTARYARPRDLGAVPLALDARELSGELPNLHSAQSVDSTNVRVLPSVNAIQALSRTELQPHAEGRER
ncbi:MAG: tyrosine-type recombinase/integrase, partial [Acidithiobacillales bacterium]